MFTPSKAPTCRNAAVMSIYGLQKTFHCTSALAITLLHLDAELLMCWCFKHICC